MTMGTTDSEEANAPPSADSGTERTTRLAAVRADIVANSALSPAFLLMNALAAVVATYGLLQNSTAVVIGAMIIAMLLGPITGIALALVEGDNRLLWRALAAEMAGAALVLAVGFLLGKLNESVPLGTEITGRTSPNIMDLLIALAAGGAGAYAALSPRISAGLVGVAIATALVPPLCTCAICLARGMYGAAGGAALLFLTNLVAIQSATSLTLWLAGFRSRTDLRGKELVRRFGPSVTLLAALAVFLTYSLQQALARDQLRSKARDYLRGEIGRSGAADLADLRIGPRVPGGTTEIVAVVRAPWIVVPQSCARLEAGLRKAVNRANLRLRVRTILTRECDSKGFLWETESGVDDTFASQ